MIVAFVTDGRLEQFAGIAAVIDGLVAGSAAITSVIVLSPAEAGPTLTRWLEPVLKPHAIPFQSIDVVPDRVDPYRIQMGLVSAFDMAGSELVLALDYDHAIRSDLRHVDFSPTHTVTLSSEVHCPPLERAWPLGATARFGAPPNQMNTSLILGLGCELARIGPDWKAAYQDLEAVVGPRYRVEMALSLALTRLDASFGPASTAMQSSWHGSSVDWRWFHFGGENRLARLLKGQMRLFARMHEEPTGRDIRLLRSELTSRVLSSLSNSTS